MLKQAGLIVAEDTGKIALIVSHGLPADQSLNFSLADDRFELLVNEKPFCAVDLKDMKNQAYEVLSRQAECGVFVMKNGRIAADKAPQTAYRI